jgi:DNA/RNA endonuclease YhcR with UshA esterase domain
VRTFPLMLVIAMASGPLVSGHHSFAAHYFEEQSVTVKGTLVEFDYSAPHAWVHLSSDDNSGTVRRYAAEWSNPNRLSRDGITKDTLKAGDYLIVTGSPGRNPGENRIHLKGIERPVDGWRWRRN